MGTAIADRLHDVDLQHPPGAGPSVYSLVSPSWPCQLALLLVIRQHSSRPLDTLAEHVSKCGVTLAFLDVLCDC